MAVITDLGTEFGVEVDDKGVTRTETFLGTIRVTSTASSGLDIGQVLHAGQAAIVSAKNAQVVRTGVAPENWQRCIRNPEHRKPSARDEIAGKYAKLVLSLNPIVYYRMERPEKESNRNRLVDSAPGAHHGELRIADEFGQPYLWGQFGQALSLRQGGVSDFAFVPHCPQTSTNQLSFSAWVMADKRLDYARIVGTGGLPHPSRQFRFFLMPTSRDLGVKVQQQNGSDAIAREGETHPLPLGSWQHVAFVADGSTLRLYRNGREVARSPCAGILSSRPETCLGIGCLVNEGNTTSSGCGWQGRLDEVALFHHALTPEQVWQLSRDADE